MSGRQLLIKMEFKTFFFSLMENEDNEEIGAKSSPLFFFFFPRARRQVADSLASAI